MSNLFIFYIVLEQDDKNNGHGFNGTTSSHCNQGHESGQGFGSGMIWFEFIIKDEPYCPFIANFNGT